MKLKIRDKKLTNIFLKALLAAALVLLFSSCKNDKEYLKYFNEGEKHLFQSDYEEAIKYFNKSIEINQNFSNSYVSRANAYIELKEFKKAEEDLNIVLDGKFSEYAKDAANYMMFFVYLKQKIHDKAFTYLDKSLSGKGGFFKTSPTAIARGYIELYSANLMKEGKLKEAELILLSGIKYFPGEYSYYVFLAYIEERLHSNSDKALAYLTKAKELSNGNIVQDPKISLKNIKKMK